MVLVHLPILFAEFYEIVVFYWGGEALDHNE